MQVPSIDPAHLIYRCSESYRQSTSSVVCGASISLVDAEYYSWTRAAFYGTVENYGQLQTSFEQ